MYIEKKKHNIKKPIVITEDKLRSIIKSVLNEMMSSFPNQYEIAELCTNELEKMVKNGESKVTVPINKGKIRNIVLTVSDLFILWKLSKINYHDGDLYVEIGEKSVRNFDWNKTYNSIVHELMHGSIFLWCYSNINDYNKIDDTPECYETLVNILDETDDASGLLYNYTYALYSCFYQETQALISQTYSSMSILYAQRGLDVITKDDFEELFLSSKPYGTFKDNIWLCDVIDGVSDGILQQEIVDVYKKYKLETTVSEIRKNTNEIRNISNDAIHKCMKNASLFYNELEKYNKIKKE